jgi:hypothetical protein
MAVTPTRRRLRAALLLWAPPLALMALIFGLSAQPDLNSGLGVWDLIGRKLLHATEYGVLVLLWWRALRESAAARFALPVAVAISLAYAAGDEYHQTFVRGRHGTPVDVGIDAVGMALAAALVRRRSR